MKINLQNNDEFDNFIREKYEKDTIEPSEELWNNINRNMKYQNIYSNIQTISKIKIVLVILSITLIGTITYFEIALQNTNLQKHHKDNFKTKTLEPNSNLHNNPFFTNRTFLFEKESSINESNQKINFNSDIKTKSKKNIYTKNSITSHKRSITNTPILAQNNNQKNKRTNKIKVTNTSAIIGNDSLLSNQILAQNNNKKNNRTNKIKVNNTSAITGNDSLLSNQILAQNNNQKNNRTNKIKVNNTNAITGNDSLLSNQILAQNNNQKNNRTNKIKVNNTSAITGNDSLLSNQILAQNNNQEKTSDKNNIKDIENNELSNDKSSTKTIEKIKKNKRFLIELSTTPQYTYRAILNNKAYYNPDLGKPYFNNRENGNYSFATGLRLYYILNDKWKISTGVEFSQYSQKMKIKSFDLKTDNKNSYYAYTSIGINNLTINSSNLINNADFLGSSTIYSFINIPVTTEYKITNCCFITGGINYNFMVSKEVNWQANDYNGNFSITTNTITGVNSHNFNFIIGVGYIKSFGTKLSMVISPQFSTYITSITNNLPINTYPYSLGLKISMRIKL